MHRTPLHDSAHMARDEVYPTAVHALDDVHDTEVTSALGLATCSIRHAFAFHRSAPAAEDPLVTPGTSRDHLHRWQPPAALQERPVDSSRSMPPRELG